VPILRHGRYRRNMSRAPGTALRGALALAAGALVGLAGCATGVDVEAPPDVLVSLPPADVRALPPVPPLPAAAPAEPAAAPQEEAPPAASSEGGSRTGAQPAPAPGPVDTSRTAEDRVFQLANAARAEAGLPPLQRMSALDDVARGWSTHLASTGADLAHNPSYSSQVPGGWSGVAENVAWASANYASDPTALADAMHAGWMNSSGHRANILGGYTHVGVGVAFSPQHGWYLTQNFAAY